MKKGWVVNYKHEGSGNYTVWLCFLMSVWKLQLVWRADLAELGEVPPVPRCLPCTFAIPGAGAAETSRACSVPPQSIIDILLHSCYGLQPPRTHRPPLLQEWWHLPVSASAALVPALPLKSHLNRSWATCSWVASGEPGPSAARDFCTAFFILVQAFLCIFCVNSGTFQLLDVDHEIFQVLLVFFA